MATKKPTARTKGKTTSARGNNAPDSVTRIYANGTTFGQPTERPLKVYAFDPSAGRLVGNYMTIKVPYEPLLPGPLGRRFAVVDYDGGAKCYYQPVDLDDPAILIRGGLDPSESDPRFHQQMVYAVATETLSRFEIAMGRRVHWRRPKSGSLAAGQVRQPNRLWLFPHAMPEANAFYSPDAHGILFGYFKASMDDSGANLPGQTVFTCLSHDVVAHEVTHAIIDGIRMYFTEPTNVDVPAFHEAFADMVALFRHFSHEEALLDTLQKSGGRLYDVHLAPDVRPAGPVNIQAELPSLNPLIQLAQQFGEASGMHSGLRSALGTPPNSDDIATKMEPHDRGSILVAAIFDAYFTTYSRRTSDLFRVYRSAGGLQHPIDLPAPLAQLLAAEASRTAEKFFLVCVRALDYCPPVDLTFGDFLRALITADLDLNPEDPDGIRFAVMQAFRLRGIVPTDARYFSEDALCWPRVAAGQLRPVTGLVFGDPNGLTTAEKNINGGVLRAYVKANAAALGFAVGLPINVPSFHPMFRVASNGSLSIDMMVEAVQTTNVPLDPNDPKSSTFPVRSGVTLVIARGDLVEGERQDPSVRYAIAKLSSTERERRQRSYYAMSGMTARGAHGFEIDFSLLHAGV